MSKPLSEALTPGHMTAQPHSGAGPRATPVLNPLELQALIEHAGRSAAARFADDFLKLFEGRLTRVDAALTTADPAAALDAVLSLKATSAMLGAERMALYCTGLETELRGQRIPHAGALPRLAADFKSALAGAIATAFPHDADNADADDARTPAPAP